MPKILWILKFGVHIILSISSNLWHNFSTIYFKFMFQRYIIYMLCIPLNFWKQISIRYLKIKADAWLIKYSRNLKKNNFLQTIKVCRFCTTFKFQWQVSNFTKLYNHSQPFCDSRLFKYSKYEISQWQNILVDLSTFTDLRWGSQITISGWLHFFIFKT